LIGKTCLFDAFWLSSKAFVESLLVDRELRQVRKSLCKILRKHTRQVVVIWSWWAAPFSRFSSRPRSPTACRLSWRSGLRLRYEPFDKLRVNGENNAQRLAGSVTLSSELSVAGAFEASTIQDDQGSEANSTLTKLCSDPKGVSAERARVQKFPHSPPKRVPSTAFARVSDGSVSTANWSKGAEPIVYRYTSPKCVKWQVCRRHVPLPVQTNQRNNALQRAVESLRLTNHSLQK
jgi:hypothetical protein